MKGPYAYRAVVVIIAAYVGLYSIFEARHERQLNLAAYERNMLITMVSAGNRGAFVAAMKNFGPIQTMSVFKEPPLFEPWNWSDKIQPNIEPLHLWARHHLTLCTPSTCGIIQNGSSSNAYKLDLTNADLKGSALPGVDFSGSLMLLTDLSRANLRESNLRQADLRLAGLRGTNLVNSNLQESDLRGADLREADLSGVSLQHANLEGAILRGALFGESHKFLHVTQSSLHTREIEGNRAKFFVPTGDYVFSVSPANALVGANIKKADLLGVKGLNCDSIRVAINWHLACRDENLQCGENLPTVSCY